VFYFFDCFDAAADYWKGNLEPELRSELGRRACPVLRTCIVSLLRDGSSKSDLFEPLDSRLYFLLRVSVALFGSYYSSGVRG